MVNIIFRSIELYIEVFREGLEGIKAKIMHAGLVN